MRRVLEIIVFLSLIFNVSLCSAEAIKANSQIIQVTVYPDSALISREVNLKLNPGEHKIIFSDIIPDVDENSLAVSGKGSAQVRIFGGQIKKQFLEKPPSQQLKELEQQIKELNDKTRNLNNQIKVLKEEGEFLDSIKLSAGEQIPKDLITKFPSASELDNLDKFLLTKLQENRDKQEGLEIKIRDLTDKIAALEKEKQNITFDVRKMQRSIVVELEAVKAGDLDLTISYLVKGVAWQPIYDARASLEKNDIELVFYGLVKQTTGEPWEDVELLLSTAKPSVGGKMPELSTWILSPFQPRILEGIVRKSSLSAGKADYDMAQNAAFSSSMQDKFKLGIPNEEIAPAEIVFSQAEAKGSAVVYKVKRKASIKSDGTEYKVPVSSQLLSAQFEYAATPKLSNYAYLMSKVKNSKDGQLLPGAVNIFLEGDFVATSSIPKAIGSEEEFDLYLGIDEGITLKRQKIEEKTDETLLAGIPSRTKSISFKYKLITENYKSKKIKVNLYDQIPVSENDQILVKNVKFSQEPKIKDYLDRKGVMRWEFELEPKASKDLVISYIIEFPRNMQVEGF